MKTAADLSIEWLWRSPPPVHLAGFKMALKRAWTSQHGSSCEDCGRPMVVKISGSRDHRPCSNLATVEHIVPVCGGGANELSNIRVICWRCNNRKSKIDWRAKKDAPSIPSWEQDR